MWEVWVWLKRHKFNTEIEARDYMEENKSWFKLMLLFRPKE